MREKIEYVLTEASGLKFSPDAFCVLKAAFVPPTFSTLRLAPARCVSALPGSPFGRAVSGVD